MYPQETTTYPGLSDRQYRLRHRDPKRYPTASKGCLTLPIY